MRKLTGFYKLILSLTLIVTGLITVFFFSKTVDGVSNAQPALSAVLSEFPCDQKASFQAIEVQDDDTAQAYILPDSVSKSNGYVFNIADTKDSLTTSAVCVLNNGVPTFTQNEFNAESVETYGALDELGRCTSCFACIGQDLMPTETRGSIGSVKPSGWQTVKYDNVEGKYLYNRCHLIGYQLTGENVNINNLITGTRYMDMVGMLPFENEVADYINRTNNHVLYRVTPVFEDNNLVASGVIMEALSVEDCGEGVMFNVFCYNRQPGIIIDYSDGSSCLAEEDSEVYSWTNKVKTQIPNSLDYIDIYQSSAGIHCTFVLNTNTMRYHYPDCPDIDKMSEKNKIYFDGTAEEANADGYILCGNCAKRYGIR